MDGADIEVDDLFGDPGTLDDNSISLPLDRTAVLPSFQAPPVKDLAKHVDELHLSGCRQRIAWSRQGCIAYVSRDRLQVNLRCLRFHPSTAKWAMSTDYTIEDLNGTDGSHPFTHVQWSHNGAELAVTDAAGRLSIVGISLLALNHFSTLRQHTIDQEDELSQVVGMYWLNVERVIPTVLHSFKSDDRWTNIMTRRKIFGPYWHRALLLLTRSGRLRLIFQRPDGKWSEVTADLELLTTTGTLLTHAAFTTTQENNVLATSRTFDGNLFIHLVHINFPDPRQDPASFTEPLLTVQNIKGFTPSRVSSEITDAQGLLNNSSTPSLDKLCLSHLEIIPTTDVEKTPRMPPVIMAVYITPVTSSGIASDGQPLSSRIRRWTVTLVERKLHATFDEVGAKAGNQSLNPKLDLQRLPDIYIDQIVTSVQLVDSGHDIAITCQDGVTTIYNTITMAQTYLETNINEVTGMSQSGFTFPSMPGAYQIAFSPSACVAASLDLEGKLQLSTMQYHDLQAGSSQRVDPGLDAALASICLAFARAQYCSSSTDDILLVILRSLRLEWYPTLMTTFYRTLFEDAELIASSSTTSKIDRIPQKQMLSRILSLQAAMGYPNANRLGSPGSGMNGSTAQVHLTLPANFAWTMLNIRYVAMQFYMIFSSAKQTGGNEWREPEVQDVVCHNIRWALELFKFIVDDLFEMADAGPAKPGDGHQHESPTVLLIISVWSRYFLKTISRVLRGLVTVPKTPGYNLQSMTLVAFLRFAEVIESSSLKMDVFERLLGGADKFVQMAYDASGYGDRERANCEREILSAGLVSGHGNVLGSVVAKLVEEVLPRLRKEVERLDLWIGDYGWIGVGVGSDGKDIDIHRKRKVIAGINADGKKGVRICVRCGSLSGDVFGAPRSFPKFSQQQMLRCVCESGLLFEEYEER